MFGSTSWKKVAVERGDDHLHIRSVLQGVGGDHVVRFASPRLRMRDFKVVERGVDIGELTKGRLLFRHIRVVGAVGFIVPVNRLSLVFALAVEEDDKVRRLRHFEDFEERADESEGTMYEFTALSHDARRHSVEHLEQEIAPVHEQQFVHLTAWSTRSPSCCP